MTTTRQDGDWPQFVADPECDPRWQAVRALTHNPAYIDPWTPAACVVEALEAAGLRIVHAPGDAA